MPIDAGFWESMTPRELFQAVSSKENRLFIRTVLTMLTFDPAWTERILKPIEEGQIELRCVLSWLARELQPETYLEVGVRRGFSMAVVAARCPDVEIYAFDSWVPHYGGVENPGPQFVQSEMEKVGYTKKVHFITGDSHKTLPTFFRARTTRRIMRPIPTPLPPTKPDTFDMMTIDGDHSLLGAYRDLLDTLPYCSPGGAVVFDDIAAEPPESDQGALEAEQGEDPHDWGDLLGVWRAVQDHFPGFRCFEYLQTPPGVGLGVRLK
jgi:predicted O-methyltransferase YrrM